jgi:proteasome lid subunit RPN8/RPN11
VVIIPKGIFSGGQVQVVISKTALNHFRNKARNSDKEIMVYMIGRVDGSGVVVDRLVYPTRYAHQTRTAVSWLLDEYRKVALDAEESGKVLVGFLHSHPDGSHYMSSADLAVCVADNLVVCGIVSIHGRTTRVSFWSVDSPVPCVITHK